MVNINAGPGIVDVQDFAAGDTLRITYTFEFDVTGYTGWVGTARPKGANDDSTDASADFDTTDIATGIVVLTFTSAQTTALYEHSRAFRYDARVKKDDGSVVTFAAGTVDMDNPITAVPT